MSNSAEIVIQVLHQQGAYKLAEQNTMAQRNKKMEGLIHELSASGRDCEDVLMALFVWRRTPQGFHFWNEVSKAIDHAAGNTND